MDFILATANLHKRTEFERLLPGFSFSTLGDLPAHPEIIEDAPDFAGNAMIKAEQIHAHSGKICLADDSGLEVLALDGAPGVHSARYVPGSDRDRLIALLEAMKGREDRRARFVCVIAICGLALDGLSLPPGLERREECLLARGEVWGKISRAPRGDAGFGYDPIFERPDGRTLAEMSAEEKHSISHRGCAARLLLPLLQRLF